MPEAVNYDGACECWKGLVGAVLPQPLKQVSQGLGRLVTFFS